MTDHKTEKGRKQPDPITIDGHDYRPGTRGYLLALEIMRLSRITQRVEALADWYDESENWRQWGVGRSIRATLTDPPTSPGKGLDS